MQQLTEEQVKLVGAVLDRITAFPKSWDQQWWYHLRKTRRRPRGPCWSFLSDLVTSSGEVREHTVVDPMAMVECGTTACVAGHTVLAAIELGIAAPSGATPRDAISHRASDLLGLPFEARGRMFAGQADKRNIKRFLRDAQRTGKWGDGRTIKMRKHEA